MAMTPDEKREYMRAWRAANRERLAAYQRAWKAEHPEYFRQRYANDPETHIAYQRRYRQRHPQVVIERRRARYQQNPEVDRAGAREWRVNNLERAKSAWAAYYARNRAALLAKRAVQRTARRAEDPERDRALRRARYAANPEPHIAYVNRRRRMALEAPGSHTFEEWTTLLTAFGGCCAICGTSEDITRDHIVPLTRGGSDDISNIQPLCRSCNARKGNRV